MDEAVALQEAAGLDVVTDGEQRRYAFFGHLVDALEGFDKSAGWAIPFHDEQGAELTLERPVVVEQAAMAAADERGGVHLSARTDDAARQGHAASARSRRRRTTILTSHAAPTPTRDAYLADLVDFTRREIQELRRLGCEYVQIDAPQYAALLDESIREGYRKRGSDPDRMLDACIELDNAIIEGHAGHHVRHPHLPRQLPEHVLRLRRLRSDRGAGLPPLAL